MGPPPAARQGGGKSNPLGSAPILGLMIQFAIPSVVGMLVTAAYNITDQIFIGNLVGMLGNAATTVSFPIFFLTSGLSQLVGVGMSANFSINQGARQEEKAKRFVTTGLALTVIAGLFLLFVAVVFRRQLLRRRLALRPKGRRDPHRQSAPPVRHRGLPGQDRPAGPGYGGGGDQRRRRHQVHGRRPDQDDLRRQ